MYETVISTFYQHESLQGNQKFLVLKWQEAY
jgi:hypothetical protein